MRQPFISRLLAVMTLGMLAACGSRGELGFLPEAAEVGRVETVLVSTTRSRGEGLPLYTAGRETRPEFLRFEIAVPPDRERGSITFPRRSPDPATDFLVVEAVRLADERRFVSAINAALAADPTGSREGVIFVHGYNTNFAEGLYRHTQLQYDFDQHGASVHFAWPSSATLHGYVYDRESALFSRDALAETIDAMARSNVRQFNLVAHSMGSMLLMDTLRTMARGGHAAAFAKLNAVVLISPDIEIDVFRVQAPPVLARGVPIFLLVAGDDRALRLSARMRGERDRLGSITSPDELVGLPVAVIDVSGVAAPDFTGHFREASSPALIGFLSGLNDQGLDLMHSVQRPSFLEGGAALIQIGANIVTAPLTGTPGAE